MDFWMLIEKGRSYDERGMTEYKEECFEKAKALREDAEYLINVLYATNNFQTMFSCTWEEDTPTIFNAYFTIINNTVKTYNDGKIEKDICEYILKEMMDLKAMFLKSVNYDLHLLTKRDAESMKTIKLYDDFKKYLQMNKEKLIQSFREFNQIAGVKLTEYDIDMITAWCYIIVLTDYEAYGTIDNGYTAKTTSFHWDENLSTAETRIEHDVESVAYRVPRLGLIYIEEEEYRKEYLTELQNILKKCGVSPKDVVKFQKNFSDLVFSYRKDNYRKYLAFDPFVNENLMREKSGCSQYIVYFIPVVGPIYFVYKIFAFWIRKLKEYAETIMESFK